MYVNQEQAQYAGSDWVVQSCQHNVIKLQGNQVVDRIHDTFLTFSEHIVQCSCTLSVLSTNKAIIDGTFPNELSRINLQNTVNFDHNRYKMMSIIGLVWGIRAQHNRNFKSIMYVSLVSVKMSPTTYNKQLPHMLITRTLVNCHDKNILDVIMLINFLSQWCITLRKTRLSI